MKFRNDEQVAAYLAPFYKLGFCTFSSLFSALTHGRQLC